MPITEDKLILCLVYGSPKSMSKNSITLWALQLPIDVIHEVFKKDGKPFLDKQRVYLGSAIRIHYLLEWLTNKRLVDALYRELAAYHTAVCNG